MVYDIGRENHVYGAAWGAQSHGYFADPAIAAPYMAAIMRASREATPDAIVDLGGGTGFICSQVVDAGLPESVRLFSMDESEVQLAACVHPRVTPMRGALQSFRRADAVEGDGRLMVICRSVLHYGGAAGVEPWVRHVRSQMREGEWFVHQSGCSNDPVVTEVLNRFFALMNADKWVPQRDEFVSLLARSGFSTEEDFKVEPVGMYSNEVTVRYKVDEDALCEIGAKLRSWCAGRPEAYSDTPGGFVFRFPYRVFMCRAR